MPNLNQQESIQTRTAVIGTAGHVDHGKSTLVKALTGIDPDRLQEEKTRQMTIDLGFAWLTLPSGRSVSVVDVPGHERFIKNMLAGVGGMDVAMLVIAADEGPMPQTNEHLAILDLLGIETGVVVLTKADLVDPDWLELVTAEVRERVAGTVLADAPVLAVSSTTGAGLPELRRELDLLVDSAPAAPPVGRPRLPIDRVFTVSGFGTVVTGTLLDGELAIGQELRVEPAGRMTRVRGLQTHGHKVERAVPGSRVAVNLANVAVDEVVRGDVLAPAGYLSASRLIDARVRLLPDAPSALKQNAEVSFFTGAAEQTAWLTLLDRDEIAPGETAWVQFRLRGEIAAHKGDRFIIRRPSPSVTIGGGEVVDPSPLRHRRFRTEVLESLETLAAGSPADIVLQALAEPVEARALKAASPGGLNEQAIDQALAELVGRGDVRVLGKATDAAPRPGAFVVATVTLERISGRLADLVGHFHGQQPLRKGMSREEARSKLRVAGPPRLFDDLVMTAEIDRRVIDDGSTLRLPEFTITLDPRRRQLADRYLAALSAQPFAPPAPNEFGVDPDTLGAIIELGDVVRVADGVVFSTEAYRQIVETVLRLIDETGSLTLAGFRDHYDSSRKFAQAMLEHLDERRVTRRVGDERVRYAGPGAGTATAAAMTRESDR